MCNPKEHILDIRPLCETLLKAVEIGACLGPGRSFFEKVILEITIGSL